MHATWPAAGGIELAQLGPQEHHTKGDQRRRINRPKPKPNTEKNYIVWQQKGREVEKPAKPQKAENENFLTSDF